MNRRLLIVLASSVLVPCWPANGQPSALDALERASMRLLEWFRSLAIPLDAIVATERRAQLFNALNAFSDDLYSIEIDKSALIQLLKRDRLNKEYIYARTGELMRSITRSRETLRTVGPLLRSQHALGGDEIEVLLFEAAAARKVWVAELYAAGPEIPNRFAAVAEGERALNALRAANAELAKLLTRLR